jgi:putative peptidoglycan lipid II flippase
MQLFIGAIGMFGLGFDYHSGVNWRNLGFREVLRLLPPRSVDQGMDYFNNLVEISIASRLKTGLINAWEVAFTLHWVPINLIGIAISTAAFPQMTERLSQGRPDLFKKEFLTVLRALIWLALPVTVVAYFGRGYLVRLLVAEGNETISNLLGLLVVAMFFRAIFHLLSRSFYAQKDTRTPLIVSVYAIGLNVFLAIFLVLPVGLGLGISGLAIAQSVAAVVEVTILTLILQKRLDHIFTKDLIWDVFKMFVAATLSSLLMYFMIQLLPLRATDVGFFALVPKFVTIVLATLIGYIAISYALRLKEPKPVVDKIMRIIFRPIKIS